MKTQIAKGTESLPSEPSSATHHTQTSMGKEAKEKEKKGKQTRENPNKKKEVIITVYVESPTPPLPIHVHQKGPRNPRNKSKPVPKAGGYDRRAQLLANAKELRNRPKNVPKPKHKIRGKSLSTPTTVQSVTRNRKRYRGLVPEVDISCRPKSVVGRKKKKKKKANRQSAYRLIGRLKGILRRFCRY